MLSFISMRSGTLRGLKYSVRQKLMMIVLATTLTALLVAGAVLVIFDLRNYQQSLVDDLTTQADIVGRASAAALAGHNPVVAQENLSLLKMRPHILAAAIYTSQGALFATYTRVDSPTAPFPELGSSDSYRIEKNELMLFKRIEHDHERLGTIYLRAPYSFSERVQNYLAILGVVIALSLLIAMLATAWMQGAITEPILAMTAVARQVMARRDFSLRVHKTTEDEIGYLVDAFNDMLSEVGRRSRELEASNRTLKHEMAERRVAETALRAADRRKDEFLATLAHELRNPLAPMRNALELLRGGGRDAQAAQSARDMMERQLRQLVHLVDDLLDVSRITTGKMILRKEKAELRTIVQNAIETASPLVEARKQRLTLTLTPEPVYLNVDATRIAQVIVNLLNNAAKFSEEGGDITLTTAAQDGNSVITISDTGIGIPPAMLPQIFDMFAQVDRALERPYAGLGVGLTLARHLVELHGGTIVGHSEGLGRGSCFTVRLPAVAVVADSGLRVDQKNTAEQHRYRILLADDNVDFAASLAMILQALGHDVRVANDGMQAVELAASFKPQVAFLDIGLPKLNGYDLARELRKLPATMNSLLVAVTGWGQENDVRRAREAGFDHHMVKPVEPDAILKILAEAGVLTAAT